MLPWLLVLALAGVVALLLHNGWRAAADAAAAAPVPAGARKAVAAGDDGVGVRRVPAEAGVAPADVLHRWRIPPEIAREVGACTAAPRRAA